MLPLKIQAAARPKLPGTAACPPQNTWVQAAVCDRALKRFLAMRSSFFVQRGNSLGSRVIFIKLE